MEQKEVKTIIDDLSKYNYNAKKDQYISITEWPNGEGYVIDIDGVVFNLHDTELEAINYLTAKLRYEK